MSEQVHPLVETPSGIPLEPVYGPGDRAADPPPPGEYPLVVGMYRLETGERLRWLAPDGSDQGDAVPLATLTIRADAP